MIRPVAEPVLLIHRERAQRNIARMAEKARANGVRLRPHFKTHQSEQIGEWFRQSGTEAITVSSPSMANVFADAGWRDITIALPANPRAMSAYAEIADLPGMRLGLIVDGPETVGALASLVGKVALWVEIDTGDRRSGVPYEETARVLAVCRAAMDAGFELRGLLTHRGGSYLAPSREAVRAVFAECCGSMAALRDRLGIPNLEISVGDTPGCSLAEDIRGVDEIRPGNYVYYDVMQWQLGPCVAEDLAIGLACPIISLQPERSECVIHGGAVHLSTDRVVWGGGESPCFGRILETDAKGGWLGALPGIWLRSLSQEHGVVRGPEEWIRSLRIGQTLVVLPVHSCLTMDAMLPAFEIV